MKHFKTFLIIILLAVVAWQYNQIQTMQADFLNLQIWIQEDIPLD